jgi:hypothetical protein
VDLQEQRELILKKIAKLGIRQDKIIEAIESDMKFTIELVEKFNNGTPDIKKEILKKLGRTKSDQ